MPLVKTAQDLGQTIRSRRKHLGWDQAQLAKQIGVSRQWVIDIEKGKARAALGLVLRAFHALGLSLHIDEKPSRAVADPVTTHPAVSDPVKRPSVDINRIVDHYGPSSDSRRLLEAASAFSAMGHVVHQIQPSVIESLLKSIAETNHLAQIAALTKSSIPQDMLKAISATSEVAEIARKMRPVIPKDLFKTVGTASVLAELADTMKPSIPDDLFKAIGTTNRLADLAKLMEP